MFAFSAELKALEIAHIFRKYFQLIKHVQSHSISWILKRKEIQNVKSRLPSPSEMCLHSESWTKAKCLRSDKRKFRTRKFLCHEKRYPSNRLHENFVNKRSFMWETFTAKKNIQMKFIFINWKFFRIFFLKCLKDVYRVCSVCISDFC